MLVVTNDQICMPIIVQNRRNKHTFDTYACTIDLVPLVLEKTCFVGQIFEYKWKLSKRRKTRKHNADSTTRNQAKAHLHAKTRPDTTRGGTQAQPTAHQSKVVASGASQGAPTHGVGPHPRRLLSGPRCFGGCMAAC